MFDASFPPPRRKFRTLFLSDLHMGARGFRAAPFLAFLNSVEAETIYLVGDILDLWHLRRVHWGPVHDEIWAELSRRQRAGTRLVYLPGNHDAALRNDPQDRFGSFEIHDSMTHLAADGTRWLVLHGDQCDARIFRFHLMTRIGSRADAALRALDQWLRRQMRSQAERGLFEWLISAVNRLMLLGNGYEKRLVALARAGGHGGVICGHFHKAALHDCLGVTYANCGDWVDNQTALAETHAGALQMLEWSPQAQPEALWQPVAEGVAQ